MQRRFSLVGLAVFCFFMLTAVGAVHAGCWKDASLEALEGEIIRKHFPALEEKRPSIVYCSKSDFENNVIGDFNPALNHIRVQHESGFPLKILVAHELGHALADRHGEEYGRFRGHGRVWLKEMVRAGFKGEAQRTAEMSSEYAGLDRLYAQVLRDETKTKQRPPPYEVDVVAFLKERPSFVDWFFKPID